MRACKLLTRHERRRLGGPGCNESLAGLGSRLRREREPSLRGVSLELPYLRGELDVRCVRPFERIGIRYEAE
ncbi:MAG: hypothetical protein GEU88_11430 [Solirubrobacterales bacterium]|nr:hypothetical protein [Solirubrobacterales bacterium]